MAQLQDDAPKAEGPRCDKCGSNNVAGQLWHGIAVCWDCRGQWHREVALPVHQKADEIRAKMLVEATAEWAKQKSRAA